MKIKKSPQVQHLVSQHGQNGASHYTNSFKNPTQPEGKTPSIHDICPYPSIPTPSTTPIPTHPHPIPHPPIQTTPLSTTHRDPFETKKPQRPKSDHRASRWSVQSCGRMPKPSSLSAPPLAVSGWRRSGDGRMSRDGRRDLLGSFRWVDLSSIRGCIGIIPLKKRTIYKYYGEITQWS